MPKHQVEIEIIGSGTQVTLYVIDDVALNKLIENSKSDDKLEYYEILDSVDDVECHHICTGIDLIDGEPTMKFTIDGESSEVDDVLYLSNLEEDEIADIENCFVYDDENVNDLEGSIPQGKHAIVVADGFKGGVLKTSFDADAPINPQDLRLEFVDLDGLADFSTCSYHLGTSGSLEYDLKSVLYKGSSYGFDFSCSNFKSCDVYLITRDQAGQLEISPMSEELFN